MADGSLNFNTKIDTNGFDKGSKNITSKALELQRKIKSTETEIKNLTKSLNEMSGTKVETNSVKKLTSDIEKADQKLADLYAQSHKMEDTKLSDLSSLGFDVNGDDAYAILEQDKAFQKLQQEIAKTETTLSEYEAKLKDIKANGGVVNAEETEEYKKKQQKLSELTDKLKVYKKQLSETKKSEQSVAKSANKSSNSIKKSGNSADSASKQLSGLSKKLKMIKNMLLSMMVFKVFSAIIDSIKTGFENLAQASPKVNTNLSKLMSSLTQLKNSLASVFAPILSVITPILTKFISILTSVIDKVASFFAALSGQKTYTKAISIQQDYAKSLDKSNKAEKERLASFDKINKLDNKSKDSGDVDPKNMFKTQKVDTGMGKIAEDFKNTVSKLFEPLQSAWDAKGKPVVDSIKNMFSSIKDLLSAIGHSFATVWTNGTGQKTVELLLSIWTNINNTIANIAKQLKTAWTTDSLGTELVQHVADIWNTILKYIDRITKKISEWAGNLDFTPLLNGLNEIEKALQPFAANVGQGLEWFFDNVLLPIGKWTVENIVPNFLEAIAGALKLINNVWKSAKPVLQYLWESFLQPIGKWVGDKISEFFSGLAKVLTDISKNQTAVDVLTGIALAIGTLVTVWKLWNVAIGIWNALLAVNPLTWIIAAIAAVVAAVVLCITYWDKIKETIGAVWDWICDLFKSVGDWIWTNMLEPIVNFFKSAWDTIKNIWSAVTGFFKGIWDGIKNIFNAVVDYFKKQFLAAWTGVKIVWSAVKEFFQGIWDGICSVFSAVGTWFKEKFEIAWNGVKIVWSAVTGFFSGIWNGIKKVFNVVVDWFGDIFSKAWEKIKSVWGGVKKWFKDLFNGIWSIIKGIINSIIGGFESVVNAIIKGINVLISGVDWIVSSVGDLFGQDWNVPKIPEVHIPKLATGTVVPANYGNFLATLGDNKREPEVVSPLSTMKQAFKEAMSESNFGGNQPIVIETNGDLDGIVSLLNLQIKKQDRLAGATI